MEAVELTCHSLIYEWIRRACLQDVLQLLEGIGQLLNMSSLPMMLRKPANLVSRLAGQKTTAFAIQRGFMSVCTSSHPKHQGQG